MNELNRLRTFLDEATIIFGPGTTHHHFGLNERWKECLRPVAALAPGCSAALSLLARPAGIEMSRCVVRKLLGFVMASGVAEIRDMERLLNVSGA